MKFSLNWLREWVKLPASNAEAVALLDDKLTAIGLEVEDIHSLGESLEHVVVGHIIDAQPHPDADRLQVCQVDAGQAEPLQIVCGAPNARVGLRAPLAMIGACLPGDFKIKAAKLRGVPSSGMLCAGKELGLSDANDGLMELPNDLAAGLPIVEALGLPDTQFELGITPNRADCFCIEGIARDVAAVLDTSMCRPDITDTPASVDDTIALDVTATDACPTYLARMVRGIDPSITTPMWMRQRLLRCGVRPVSLAVDITQYVMLELGQPMHAFDAAKLGSNIGVRMAKVEESLTLLDERTVTLDDSMLVITSDDQAIALAGIMGGLNSRVTESTVDVVLESAHFTPDTIAGRARKLNMSSDAAHRFERGVDPTLPERAMHRATALLLSLAGGQAGPICTASAASEQAAKPSITLRHQRLNRLLGADIDAASVDSILTRLGMSVVAEDGQWQVTAPSHRFDIAIEEDLIEEVARIYGYDNIADRRPHGDIHVKASPSNRVSSQQIRHLLAARDYAETIHFSFVDEALLKQWGMPAGIALANPLSSELGQMRPSLLPGLVATTGRNLARQQARVRLFEIGRSFHQQADGHIEPERLALVAAGNAQPEQWSDTARNVDFYDVKADIEAVLALRGQRGTLSVSTDALPSWLHPGKACALLLNGQPIGHLGHLHPSLVSSLDLGVNDLVVAELTLAPILSRDLAKPSAISNQPSLRRDLAFLVPEQVSWQEMAQSVRELLGSQLVSLTVFDQFSGQNLESGFKSIAMGLIIQDVSRTLTVDEADAVMHHVVSTLQDRHAARLRG